MAGTVVTQRGREGIVKFKTTSSPRAETEVFFPKEGSEETQSRVGKFYFVGKRDECSVQRVTRTDSTGRVRVSF